VISNERSWDGAGGQQKRKPWQQCRLQQQQPWATCSVAVPVAGAVLCFDPVSLVATAADEGCAAHQTLLQRLSAVAHLRLLLLLCLLLLLLLLLLLFLVSLLLLQMAVCF
jgi:hypothetical protein